MSNNSAAYSNMQSDLYRVVNNALTGTNKQLETIQTTLTEIKDLLILLVNLNNAE